MGFDELQESQEEVYKLRDKIDALEAKVERLLQDALICANWITGNWPGYEDCISWGDDLDPTMYDFYNAARRIQPNESEEPK